MCATSNTWTRPASVPYPSIWRRFKGRKEIDGVVPHFWVQDIPEDQFEEIIELMTAGFSVDEPLNKHADMVNDPTSVDDLRRLYHKVIKGKLGLVCYMENPDPNGKPIIAGINMTYLKEKSEKSPEPKGEVFKMVMKTFEFISIQKDPFEVTGSDRLLSAMGLYVSPEFRGQGIGLEILKAREPLCKAVGIKASVTVFTATGSQILAERAGFQDMFVISYVDLQRLNPVSKFPGIENHTKNLRHMYKIYE